jgi:arabinofuranan 3-O-arabinosyltransferase
VSVIIPTKNASRTIGSCLKSIREQTYSETDIIVVDNNSQDSTHEISRAYDAKFFSSGPERGAQKNFGFEKSSGTFVLFVDADMTLAPDVIEDCVRCSRGVDAIMIPEISVGEGFWTECRILERSCYRDDDWLGAARFFRRDVFEKLGGFDETLQASGDDMDLNQRARRSGYRIGRAEACITHDEGIVTPRTTFRKWRYYGRNMMTYVRKNKKEATMQYLPIRPAWIRHWRKLSTRPPYTFGFMILKGCQLLGVLTGHLDERRNKTVSGPYL